MEIDERARFMLYERLKVVLGVDEADALIRSLPPVGWGEVATKRDLDDLRLATKRDIDELRVATRRDLAAFQAEVAAEFGAVRQEMNAGLGAVRQEMNAQFAVVEQHFTLVDERFAHQTDTLLAALRGEVNRFLLSAIAAMVVLVVALVELT